MLLTPENFTRIGQDLHRPEDVVVGADGAIYASDQTAAVSLLTPGQPARPIGKAGGAPNGIAMDRAGGIIIANFGVYVEAPGPLQRLDLNTGDVSTLVGDIGGRRLSACNFPVVDRHGSIWCTHSTWGSPWQEALDGRRDGFVFRLDPDGHVEIVAEGLQFPNGCALDPDETHLYVCQTTGFNVLRFPIQADRTLGDAEQYGPLLGVGVPGPVAPGAPLPPPEIAAGLGYTDGCGFALDGSLWVTLPVANKIVAIRPDGDVDLILHDPHGVVINHPTNISWGGADLRDLYVGSIYSRHIAFARSPVAGAALVHQLPA